MLSLVALLLASCAVASPVPEASDSPDSDFAPGLGAGGRSLFFTSERPGLVKEGEVEGRPPGDLYFVRLPDRNR